MKEIQDIPQMMKKVVGASESDYEMSVDDFDIPAFIRRQLD